MEEEGYTPAAPAPSSRFEERERDVEPAVLPALPAAAAAALPPRTDPAGEDVRLPKVGRLSDGKWKPRPLLLFVRVAAGGTAAVVVPLVSLLPLLLFQKRFVGCFAAVAVVDAVADADCCDAEPKLKAPTLPSISSTTSKSASEP